MRVSYFQWALEAHVRTPPTFLQSRALSMAWNLTTNYGSGWFYVIPNDQILMVYPATDDVYKMPDQSAWDACDFTKAERVCASSSGYPPPSHFHFWQRLLKVI